jgi:pimeloyl-ACP methyl ester carboxylesterase
VRRRLLALVTAVAVVAGLGLAAARYDRPPVAPGSWLDGSGLEARETTVDGHRLRYVRTGTGSLVVLVHGFASSLYTWKDLIPLLAESHDVVALDLPGFGASDLPVDLSFEDLPAAVVGLMDHLGIGRAALVGNSMGGTVVAVVAAERPERVEALVLVDAAGFNTEAESLPLPVRLMTTPLAGLLDRLPGKRLLVERSLREVFHDDGHVTDERVSEYLAAARRPGSVAALQSLLASSADRRGAVIDRLPRIEAPTLVVWGRDDLWIPVAHADRFVEAIPGARKVVLDECGHLPHVEKPEVVGAALVEFLGATSARGG